MQLPIDPETVKGFLDPEEGARLFELGAACDGPGIEVGSYCGKSTVYLGTGFQQAGEILFALDHHRGSEEHQRGEGYHDPELYDREAQLMDSLPAFRRTLTRAALEDTVIPVVAPTVLAGRHWHTPLHLVFIDGGHSLEAAMTDYRTWAPHIVAGGVLAIHDIFFDPNEGGQAPRTIYELAAASGLFETLPMTKTLGVLRRIG